MITYKNYIIELDVKTIGRHDYSFYHIDFDGAVDSHDVRCGLGCSEKDCMLQIDEIENDIEEGIYNEQ